MLTKWNQPRCCVYALQVSSVHQLVPLSCKINTGITQGAAGISDYALIPVSTALLMWADEIVCVEPDVTEQLLYEVERLVKQDLWTQDDYDEVKGKIITLNIPDIYEQMNPTLQRICIEQYEEAINEN